MQPFCAAVDWGTTSFRLWLLDDTGAVLAASRSEQGILNCPKKAFAPVLEEHLQNAGAPASLPVMICGMAGSRQGWVETGYLDAPLDLPAVINGAVAVSDSTRDVRILPGIAQRERAVPDVMRVGEETQLLGLMEAPGTTLVCIPGTHSKWIRLDGDRIERFTTFLTGELFSLIGRKTILRHAITGTGIDVPVFRRTVIRALDDPARLTADLFAIRAGHLLDFTTSEQGSSTLSGLLIGTEIAAARKAYPDTNQVQLISSGILSDLYTIGLDEAGFEISHMDAEAAAQRGLFLAAAACFGQQSGIRKLG